MPAEPGPKEVSHKSDSMSPNQVLQSRPLIEASMLSQKRGGWGYGTAIKMAEAGTLRGVARMGRYWRIEHGSFNSVVQQLIDAGEAQ